MRFMKRLYSKTDVLKDSVCQNCKDENGAMPTHNAARQADAQCLRIIADIAPESFSVKSESGFTPAHFAAHKGYADCLRIIAEVAPELFKVTDDRGFTPAHFAASEGHTDCLRIILRLLLNYLPI